MSVSSTEQLDKLQMILYGRPAGRNIIGYAIETIERLRSEVAFLKAKIARLEGRFDLLGEPFEPRPEFDALVEIDKLRADMGALRDELRALKPAGSAGERGSRTMNDANHDA